MPDHSHELNDGGLYRCCVAHWLTLTRAELDKLSSVPCPHCKAVMVKEDDLVWRWARATGRVERDG